MKRLTYQPTSKTYFSGAGGMDLGLIQAGVKVVQSLEIHPVYSDTLRTNFSHKVVTADIATQMVLDQERTDISAFTYPCTKYSGIADIHGTRTGDNLFLHALRHMAIERPEAYVVENVPGMRKFPIVMEAMTKMPDYYVNVFCPLDTVNWLPQTRKRLIIIGTKKPFNISPPSGTRRVRLSEILESNPEIDIPEYVYSRMRGKYRDLPIISDPAKDDIAPTCVAHYAKDKGTRLVADKNYPMGVRPYTVKEYARLQGFPDWFKFSGSDNDAYTQIGNAVGVPVGNWIGEQFMRYFN